MSRSAGQQLGYDQLVATATASRGAVRIGRVIEPTDRDTYLRIELSIDCSTIGGRSSSGIRLRGRERFSIPVPADFPFRAPSVLASHRRWAGTPHVQWGRSLCLYQAASEWSPQSGMYGLMERLDLWLGHAVAGDLDPADAPLHPPAQYGRSDALVTVQANCPTVTDTAWIGFGDLVVRSPRNVEITGWSDSPETEPSSLAILLPHPLDWEYPTRVSDLFDIAVEQGVALERLQRLLTIAAQFTPKDSPMYVVIGAPMRRGHANEPLQHLAVWDIPADLADGLRSSFSWRDESKELLELRQEIKEIVFRWATASTLSWCYVSENRPEIVIRRDSGSPAHQAFVGRHVSIWGCGAIGGHVAQWVARAGASRITLYDNDIVTPGVLVRQPYTDADIGHSKARKLAECLRQIRPQLRVDHHVVNVLDGPLSRSDWHDSADVLIDATASAPVRLKLERARSAHPAPATTIACLLFGHDVERGVAVVTPSAYPGGPEDALRQTKLACSSDPELKGFADEFWPLEPRTDHFQPEPGCSDATFRGAAAEVVAVSSALLGLVARDLVGEPSGSASAHLLALPGADHAGRREFSATFVPPTVLNDGVGNYEIRLSSSALAEIRGWTSRNDRVNQHEDETGGVLVGRRDETARIVWIDSVSGPPPDSNASPQRFECGTSGVASFLAERLHRSRGETTYLGMWHTHPSMRPTPSEVDLEGMAGLVATQDAREAVMLIVGGVRGDESLGGYVFNGDSVKRTGLMALRVRPQATPPRDKSVAPARDVGLALSGGGARALAFHLGCLRALHDRGVLPRIRVVSGVSGGALMTALFAYGPQNFAEFDERVVEILRKGLQWRIARRTLISKRLPQSVATRAVAGTAALAAGSAGSVTRRKSEGAPLQRWVSRTDAFQDILQEILGDLSLDAPRREDGLDVVINACDLRTGSAFRFGSQESGSSHIGRLTNTPAVATAVAASAAYPLFLPALDRAWEFVGRDGTRAIQRIALTDGGVYDNSGASAFRPGKSAEQAYNVFGVDYVIACDAGRGVLAPKVPFHVASRTSRAFEASFRKLQDASRGQLHDDRAAAKLKGFVMPYLGQIDARLPWSPPDLVRREDVVEYPTDFKAMKAGDLSLIAGRGEQLARLLVERWCPDL